MYIQVVYFHDVYYLQKKGLDIQNILTVLFDKVDIFLKGHYIGKNLPLVTSSSHSFTKFETKHESTNFYHEIEFGYLCSQLKVINKQTQLNKKKLYKHSFKICEIM